MALATEPPQGIIAKTDVRQPQRRLLTAEEFHKAAEAGIIRVDEAVELIEGEIYTKMSPQGRKHWVSVVKTAEALKKCFHTDFCVVDEKPILLSEHTEPEPDVSVVRGAADDYIDQLPRPADVVLVVEVADTSLSIDRSIKTRLYADAGIPEYWIVNLNARMLEVYCDPVKEIGYRTSTLYLESEHVIPVSASHCYVSVVDLLPIDMGQVSSE